METPIKYRTLYVPATLVEEYKKVAPWNEFKQILPMSDEELGIDGKEYQDETAVSYYRPDGKQLQSPQRGLNIVRHADGTAKTVVVKWAISFNSQYNDMMTGGAQARLRPSLIPHFPREI